MIRQHGAYHLMSSSSIKPRQGLASVHLICFSLFQIVTASIGIVQFLTYMKEEKELVPPSSIQFYIPIRTDRRHLFITAGEDIKNDFASGASGEESHNTVCSTLQQP